MAVTIKIEFYTRWGERPWSIVEPSWWRPAELIASYPFTCELINGYALHNYSISKANLEELHRQQLKHLPEQVRTELNKIVIRQLEHALYFKTVFKKIQVLIFEWKSED